MRDALPHLLSIVRTWLGTRAELELEILALRHQSTVLRRQRNGRPRFASFDRTPWVWPYRLRPSCLDALVIVRPQTVVTWHRKGYRLLWTWKSRRRKEGEPPVPREVRELILRISRENPLWGTYRIHGELPKLGIEVSEATVSKYMTRPPKPPSRTWRTFLRYHANCLASIDIFVPPSATSRLLFVFIALRHERRRIVHFGVTANLTAA